MPQKIKEGKGEVPRLAHEEGIRAAAILKRRIKDAGFSVRSVERELEWGQKTLNQVLTGDTPLRFSHAAAVLEVVGDDVGDFYLELAAEGRRGGGPSKKKPKKRAPVQDDAPAKPTSIGGLSDDEIVSLFRDFLKRWKRGESGEEEDKE
jgi:hypothetical protein